MKDAEDEAFDDIARRQGAWGGGYQAKRKMAADKLQEPRLRWDRPCYKCRSHFCDLSCEALAQPAQEQRPWVGLTDEDLYVVREEESCSFIAGAEWAAAILKEKNS